MIFGCKKCKKVFRKDFSDFDESDEYCPHCDNHYYIHTDMNQQEEPQLIIAQSDNPEELKKAFGGQVNFTIDPRMREF
eukprot:TRINITY_DN4349_c0_g1_i2.p1 TRINITY_DN4349_c0_g1~~TRINITY_DN4349_c0_g1_i2.p1  ORF type:complete len:78 (-),score=16.52 TRINITY_DN4349_c0_g1_i2:62-295(-)